MADLAAALDVPQDTLAEAYWRLRDAYDRGGSSEVFWGGVTAQLGRTADPAELDRIDTARWSTLTPEAAALLADLVAGGTRLAVLSNAPAPLAAVVRAAAWSEVFSVLVFSADVAMMKPEPAIYQLARDRFGGRGEHLLFFDDRPVNVEGARRAGWAAQVWTGADSARHALVEAGVLDARRG